MTLPALAVGRAYLYGRAIACAVTAVREPEKDTKTAACQVLGGCMPDLSGVCVYCGEGAP